MSDARSYPFIGPATRDLLGHIKVRSMQGIALVAHGKPMGVLYVNYTQPRVFSVESWAALQTFAEYAATALDKARVMDQLHKARDTARVIADVMATADLDSALQTIVSGVRDVLGCGPVVLYVHDAGKKLLRYPPNFIRVKNPVDMQRETAVRPDSIIHPLLDTGGITIVPNTADDLSLIHI